MSDLPVFIWIGASDEEQAEKMPLVQAEIARREKEFGRPLNSSELLATFGEVIEPDASKRTHLSSGQPKGMPPLR